MKLSKERVSAFGFEEMQQNEEESMTHHDQNNPIEFATMALNEGAHKESRREFDDKEGIKDGVTHRR